MNLLNPVNYTITTLDFEPAHIPYLLHWVERR
jgi:hypothetical protein